MRWLKAAIARILTGTGGATPTLNAGPVHPEPTTPTGKVTTAQATQPQPPSLPAQARSRKKQKAAPQTTAGSKSTSKKSKPAQTGKSPTTGGNSTQTPARRTRRHAK
jgi:hypothetical protein